MNDILIDFNSGDRITTLYYLFIDWMYARNLNELNYSLQGCLLIHDKYTTADPGAGIFKLCFYVNAYATKPFIQVIIK